ncbi:DUF1365 domain-containing protein [bacterium SCSIO 12696]|nr:DUF1365 domain-containing protein [bacterium SCSIO 12696]
MLPDGIYKGWVQHSRHRPRPHRFRYPMAMVLLDLDQLQKTFSKSRWWSLERFNAIGFYRKDYLAAPEANLKEAVINAIFRDCGDRFEGTVKILTQPRYFGIVFNPVTYYFCYNPDNQLSYIVTEINNTPWNERHSYVLPVVDGCTRFEFDKEFHVSPFMPMDLQYHWRFTLRAKKAHVHMTLLKDGLRQFDAVMSTKQQPLTSRSMAFLPIHYPMQTLLVVLRIYWQALRLWLKRIPFFDHPNTHSSSLPKVPLPEITGDKS